MQAILLAAGQSSRLQPLSDKNLLEFCGKPLIQHRVESLLKTPIEKMVIVGNGYNLDALKQLFDHEPRIEITQQGELNNSQADGVLAGAEKITSDKVMILSTNDVFDDSLIHQMINISPKDKAGVITGKQVKDYFPGGYLKVDEQGFLTHIIEKPVKGNEPSDLVNMVLHVYYRFSDFVRYLKNISGHHDGRYEAALDQYLNDGAKIQVITYDGFWQAIKYPWHVLWVMNRFLDTQIPFISKAATIAPSAILKGNVVIEDGAKILDHAVIQGPAYIGKNSIVATNSLVRHSMIGRESVVGFGTEIARSYLNREVWTHSNYVGDSIVDFNVSFGAGTVLGNLRFDENEVKVKIKGERISTGTPKFGAVIGNGVRFGVNASTSPGVKVGSGSFVGANVLVEKDVEGGKVVLVEQQIKVLDNEKEADVKNRV